MAEFDFKRVFEAGGYDTYNPHLNHDAKHLTIAGTGYYRLANLVKQQMAKPGNTQKLDDVIAAVASQYSREFGPAATTAAKIKPLVVGDQKGLKHGDYSQARTEDAHDVMPRKNKIDQADAMLNMKTADEVLAPVAASNKPTPNITEAQNRLWECGCDAMDDQESSMAFAVDGIGNIMQIAKVDNRDNDPDYQLESDWFGDATQELIDRCSAGEEWIEVVNELAQRFAEFFDGAYQAHDFASDAFGRRAWEMGLWESQGMAAEFARSGKFVLPESAKTASLIFRGLRKVLEAPTKKTLTKVFVVEAKREGYVRVGSKPVFESMPARKTKLVGRFWPV